MEKEQGYPLKKLTPFWKWLPVPLTLSMMAFLVLAFVYRDETGRPDIPLLVVANVIAVVGISLEKKYVGREIP